MPGALADRVVVEGGRARAVAVQTAEGPGLIAADTIVLTGEPLNLLR